jgi:hypothetical protein
MAVPMKVVLSDGDWDVVQGLVTAEWALVRDNMARIPRKPYLDTLADIRQKIIARTKA